MPDTTYLSWFIIVVLFITIPYLIVIFNSKKERFASTVFLIVLSIIMLFILLARNIIQSDLFSEDTYILIESYILLVISVLICLINLFRSTYYLYLVSVNNWDKLIIKLKRDDDPLRNIGDSIKPNFEKQISDLCCPKKLLDKDIKDIIRNGLGKHIKNNVKKELKLIRLRIVEKLLTCLPIFLISFTLIIHSGGNLEWWSIDYSNLNYETVESQVLDELGLIKNNDRFEIDFKNFPKSISHCAYFVVQTGSTLGFGEITPVLLPNHIGQFLVVLICSLHIFIIVVLIAVFLSYLTNLNANIDNGISAIINDKLIELHLFVEGRNHSPLKSI